MGMELMRKRQNIFGRQDPQDLQTDYSYLRDRMQPGAALRSSLGSWVYSDVIRGHRDRRYYSGDAKLKQVPWIVGEARLQAVEKGTEDEEVEDWLD